MDSKFPIFLSDRTSIGCTGQVWSMEAPSINLQELKSLLLMSRCQMPQHTFKGLVKPMRQWVRAVLAGQSGPKQDLADVFNVTGLISLEL